MPKQDTSRTDRKQKRRKIVCVETGEVFSDAQNMADALDITLPHVYNIIRTGAERDGRHYNWMPETNLIKTVCQALNEQDQS